MNTNRSVLLKADKLLSNHYINRLPLTLEELERIADKMGWLLDTYQDAAGLIEKSGIAGFVKEHKALTTIHNGQIIILYDGQLSYSEKLQYICHEMGHVVLRHTTENGIVGLCSEPKRMVMQEDEADAFAAEMMAPACVMRERGISSLEGLINTGYISEEQAVKHFGNIAHYIDTGEEQKLCDIMRVDQSKITKHHKRHVAVFGAVIVAAVLSVGALLLFKFSSPSILNIPSTASDKVTSSKVSHTETNVVYVTSSGKKYHKLDCYHIAGKDNIIELSTVKAEQAGYEPCKDCFSF